MGWTLFACFGCAKKRKRPKTGSKSGSKSRRRTRARGYELLKSEGQSKGLDISELLSSSREMPKDEKKAKIRKKVRFNLDVVTYEPLSSQADEHVNNWEESNEGKETEQVAENSCVVYAPVVISRSKTIFTEGKLPLYSSNYRYNCYDGEDECEDDEDDDNERGISDDDEYDDRDDEANDGDSDADGTIDSRKLYYEEMTEEELCESSSWPLIGSAKNARFRSHYIVPVLNPIENLSQWKAVKTRTRKC